MLPRRLLAAAVGSVVLIVASPAAAETLEGDLVLIRESDVVAEDLYAVGNRIDIDGVVEGDLLAAAFGEVRIDGTIDGSVLVVASEVVITGEVTGSVRALAGRVRVEGVVGEDVAVAAGVVDSTAGSSIGRDLLAASWAVDVDGAVERSVEAFARSISVQGAVGESVVASSRSLEVGPDAEIGGDLAYRSSTAASVDDAATVGGSVLARRPLEPNVRVVALGLMLRVLLAVFAAALGLVAVWTSVRRSEGAAEVLRSRGVAATAAGVGVASIPLLVVAVLAVLMSLTPPESAIPLVLATLPVLLGVLGLLVLGALVAPVPPAILIGNRLLGRRSPYARFLVGFAVIVALALFPYVGRWLLAVVVLLGLGSWLLPARI